MVYQNDNTTIQIPVCNSDRRTSELVKIYTSWLDERNVKYSRVYQPIWNSVPTGISMRNEDAIAFKLVFGL